jgi:hypothetical protein
MNKNVKSTVAPSTAPVITVDDLDAQIAKIQQQKRELILSRLQPMKDELATKFDELLGLVVRIKEGDETFIPPFTIRTLERTVENLQTVLANGSMGKMNILEKFSGSNKVITTWLDEQATAKVITKTEGKTADGVKTITFGLVRK